MSRASKSPIAKSSSAKAPAKAVARKTVAKKAIAKKAVAKKAAAKKVVGKPAAPKKAIAKKAAAKPVATKKVVAKKVAPKAKPTPAPKAAKVTKAVKPPAPRKAIFFDRDGVVNESPGEGSYVLSWWDFYFLPGVDKVLTYLKSKGYFLVLVTNQQCVGKGIINQAQLDAIHERMQTELGPKASFDAIYACTALKSENSPMRKPAPGMILAARDEHNLDVAGSWLIGDHDRDIELARNARVGTAVRFLSEKAVKVRAEYIVKDHVELLKLVKSKL
jgi:D-glycero-D-manno-heptose 1,7-bisphosphate phosphatase